MEMFTKARLKMEKKMVMEFIIGVMETIMTANGKTILHQERALQ
jgi:hypothetical protein